MVQPVVKRVIKSSNSAEIKPRTTDWTTSGSTAVASTKQTPPSFHQQLILCSAGTGTQSNATYIFRTFQLANTPAPLKFCGNQHSNTASGLPEAGHSRSFLLHHQLNSSPGKGNRSA